MDYLKRLLNEDQNPARAKKALKKLHQLLTKEEAIACIAVQRKPINIAPEAIALTNKRIIICRPRKLGLTMKFDDILWKQVTDCHLMEKLMGSKFEVLTVEKALYTIDYLPKAQARKIVSACTRTARVYDRIHKAAMARKCSSGLRADGSTLRSDGS